VTVPFDRRRGLVIVDAEVSGPARVVRARLLVDTGSAMSLLRPAALAAAGYDLARPRSVVRVAAVGGILEAPLFVIGHVSTLGQEWREIAELSYPLLASLPFSGLLGANLLRERHLAIDYRAGFVSVE